MQINDFDFDPFSDGNGSDSDSSSVPGSVPKYLEALNDKQREAVQITDGPLIVLAGAGSGKTKMLTTRIAHLIQARRIAPHNILAMTFTNKAAGEMRERVERTLNIAATDGRGGPSLGAPEIGTFHSVCVRLLRREAARTPFSKPFVIYDDSDQLTLVKAAIEKLGLDSKSISPKGVQAAINRMKCDAIEPHEMNPSPHNVFERQVRRVYEQYQKDLFSNNALDFGEIICMTYRILRDNTDVREKYQKRYRFIHVDEYQDTNRSQYLLLMMLASAQHGGHKNICVVGDEDQSIYKWRGADIRNILDFENDFPGAQVVKLEQNYRSTKTIIRAAGEVIRNNRSRKDKTLWTDNDEGIPIIRAQLPDERAEAEMVVSEVKKLASGDERTFSEFAIFYRTNAQSRQFEDVLRREKIPYQIVGGLRFYDRKEIKDVMSYFRVILNQADSISLKRIINVPARGIGKTTLEKIDQLQIELQGQADSAHATCWDALQLASRDPSFTSTGTARKLSTFVDLVNRLIAEQPKLNLSELYHLILDETGYVRELRQEATEEAMARIENLEEFDTLVTEFEEDLFENLTEEEKAAKKPELLPLFIEQSSLASDADSHGNEVAVKLMTLHSSKGLEFPVVFLVGMEEGLFPSVKPWEETPDEDIEEERRLCYVGMTRARETLYMMNAMVRRLWGNVTYQEPARFFQEISTSLLEFKDFSHQASGVSQFRLGSSRQLSPSYDRYSDVAQAAPSKPRGYTQQPELVGQGLIHPEYGPGRVIQSEGSGEDQKITVEFKNRQQKKFMLRYVAEYLQG
jgi:DNA helicase II / ATP-dependent DNA helicase PcrA